MLNEEEKIQFLTGKLNPVLKPCLNVVRIFLSTASQYGLFVFQNLAHFLTLNFYLIAITQKRFCSREGLSIQAHVRSSKRLFL
jgi:hypothetical protein